MLQSAYLLYFSLNINYISYCCHSEQVYAANSHQIHSMRNIQNMVEFHILLLVQSVLICSVLPAAAYLQQIMMCWISSNSWGLIHSGITEVLQNTGSTYYMRKQCRCFILIRGMFLIEITYLNKILCIHRYNFITAIGLSQLKIHLCHTIQNAIETEQPDLTFVNIYTASF